MSASLPALRSFSRELAAKHGLEAAMYSEPDNDALRALYFQQLGRLARTHVGLCEVRLPELPHPLTLRCGSTDIDNLEQIFWRREYDFVWDLPAPARILDLGAYVGYAAVCLANRFPDAQILCVEPVPSSFRILLLNTLPFRNISHLNAAAWSHNGRVQLIGIHGGHWGYQLAGADEGAPGDYRCFTIAEILRMRGWDRAEFVKCDVEGAEAMLFADPGVDWIRSLDVLAIETHDRMALNSAAVVRGCFDPELFSHAQYQKFDVYQRQEVEPQLTKPIVIPLIHSGPGLSPMTLGNAAPVDSGFFLFDERGCQLPPNPPGEPSARLAFNVECNGQNRFTTVVLHAGHQADEIIFRVRIRRVADDIMVADRARRVLAGAGAEWIESIPVLQGPHEVVLETEMAEGALTNRAALARWIDSRLS